ncbi:MAG: RNA polymerase sigma factor [Mucilaginibacter sp.]
MKNPDIIPHLFRTEFSKITTVLCKFLGLAHIEIAEDIAGETFLAALETWPYKGVPENPVAWLYAVAKNKVKNHLNREQLYTGKIALKITEPMPTSTPDDIIDLSDQNITDSQLQMLFAICRPGIAIEAQIALALRILCGFGIDEIAAAFLTNKETINKRLYRAKEKLRTERAPVEMPSKAGIDNRLEAVLTTLYLLFNEGYYSESNNDILRKDLCLEAMRLSYMLIENKQTDQPMVNALFALMCFHSSRFEARKNHKGDMVLYDDQDENLWNNELIAQGAYFLHKASTGDKLSKYHLEASIAFWLTKKADTTEKWENILHLHNQLLVIGYTPIAALNRAYAVAKVRGNAAGIIATEQLALTDNRFYHVLLGELYCKTDPKKAMAHLKQALLMAKTETDKQLIQTKINKF